jgi:hypothetical protein
MTRITPSKTYIKIDNATKCYYKQLNPEELTEEDFNLWIENLQKLGGYEEFRASAFKNEGLDSCRKNIDFKRFILELQGKGLDEYLKNNLTEEEFSYYLYYK